MQVKKERRKNYHYEIVLAEFLKTPTSSCIHEESLSQRLSEGGTLVGTYLMHSCVSVSDILAGLKPKKQDELQKQRPKEPK